MHKAVCHWIGAAALLATTTCEAGGAGFQPRMDDLGWAGLQGRLAFGLVPARGTDTGTSEAESQRVAGLSVMGDYYLTRPWLGTAGGLRATSGVLLGSRLSLWSSPAPVERRNLPASSPEADATLPYLGVGYTSLSSKSGWGLSADFGLMATNPRSAVRLGRVVNGSQSLDDAVRELRLSPLLQLGVSYSF